MTQKNCRKLLIQVHTGWSRLCSGCPLHRLLDDRDQPHAGGHHAVRPNWSHFPWCPAITRKCAPGGLLRRPRCRGAVRGPGSGGPALSLSAGLLPSAGVRQGQREPQEDGDRHVTLSTEHKAWHAAGVQQAAAGWRT